MIAVLFLIELVPQYSCLTLTCSHLISSQLERVQLIALYEMADPNIHIRAGSTEDPERRRRDYVYQNHYAGTMYYAQTTNMRNSENQLLQHNFRDNVQRTSNAREAPGYVYLIREN